MTKRYAIGIDPGISTALAVWDRREKAITFKETMTFWQAFDTLANFNRDECLVVVETPMKTRLYARQDREQGARRREKIAANAGGNAREAELLAEGVERLGFEVRRVVPQKRKLNAEQFERVTGMRCRTNQHIRDSVLLVWGM